ncbi:MAG: hypothetical protein K0A90_08475, partial [Methanosarcinaceae archaeon]|nr:hypothetical protein [Methanosarcinaceae archaeon]
MQHKDITKNDERALLKILGAKHMAAILNMSSVKQCSAHMLSDELNIPMGSAYRKLKILEDAKLIYLAQVIVNKSGNEEKYYGCLLDKATINFHDGTFSI